nr:LysR family transcriptional regulator [Candidatus Pantoea persica]
MDSFIRAAESVCLPKGSVSRQLQALENQMGTRLLHRTTRRVQLTQDGLVYYDRCLDLLSMIDDMEGLFQHNPATLSGKLRVDMSVAMATNFILPRLPEFFQHCPGVEIELSSSDRMVDVIREGFVTV